MLSSPTQSADECEIQDPNNMVVNAIKFINNVSGKRVPKQWICLDGIDLIETVLDTGSEVNVISSQSYNKMRYPPPLRQSFAKLIAYNSTIPIPTIGEFSTNMSWNGKTKAVDFVVVNSKERKIENLLSLDTMIHFDVDLNEML